MWRKWKYIYSKGKGLGWDLLSTRLNSQLRQKNEHMISYVTFLTWENKTYKENLFM